MGTLLSCDRGQMGGSNFKPLWQNHLTAIRWPISYRLCFMTQRSILFFFINPNHGGGGHFDQPFQILSCTFKWVHIQFQNFLTSPKNLNKKFEQIQIPFPTNPPPIPIPPPHKDPSFHEGGISLFVILYIMLRISDIKESIVKIWPFFGTPCNEKNFFWIFQRSR